MKKRISVIIPTKNEASGIRRVIRKVLPYVDEVLVVDGHSEDGTAEIARRMGVKVILDNGRGVGAAKRIGIAKAKGEIVVLMDADGSHEAKDIPKLVRPIIEGDVDLVVASRLKGGSDEFYINFCGIVRQSGGDLMAAVINHHFKVSLTDTLCGYRAIRRFTALKIGLEANDFDIEAEMIIKCLRKGYKVMEVPSHEYARGWGKAKLPTFSKGWVFIWRLLKELY